MYDVPRRKKLRDRCAEPWKRKGAAVSGGVPPFPGFRSRRRAHQPGVCRYFLICGKSSEGRL